MKKLFLFLLVCIMLFGYESTFSARYNNHAVSYSSIGSNPCDDDGGGDGTYNQVALNNLSSTVTPHGSSASYGYASAGSIRCLYWDATNPVASANNATSTWKNADISITLLASDLGGSTLSYAKYRWDNSDCVNGTAYSSGTTITLSTEGSHTLYLCVGDVALNTGTWSGVYNLDKTLPVISATNATSTWKNANISITLSASDLGGSTLNSAKYRWDNSDCLNGTAYSSGTSLTLSAEGAHVLYLCATDFALNTSTWSGSYNLDKTAPVAGDVTGTGLTLNGQSITMTGAQDFSVTINPAGGSPIVSIAGFFEGVANDIMPTDLITSGQAVTSNTGTLTLIRNIGSVNANGTREYSFLITQICDQAGNCGISFDTYNYNVEGPSVAPEALVNTFSGALTSSEYQAYIAGKYRNRVLRIQSGGRDKIYALPSMIITNTGNIDLKNTGYGLSLDRSGNFPSSYSPALGSGTGGVYMPNTQILIYDGPTKTQYSLFDLNIIANKLKKVYAGSSMSIDKLFNDLFTVDNAALIQFLNASLNPRQLQSVPETKIYDWSNVDPECTKPDIFLDTQQWAGCNSTLGLGTSFSVLSNSCYNYNGLTKVCSSTNYNNTENDFVSGQSNNIWGKFYTSANKASACPTGWRVPTDTDWANLEVNLACTDNTTYGWICDGLGWKGRASTLNNLVSSLGLPLAGNIDTSNNLKYRGYQSVYWTSSNVTRKFYYNGSTEGRQNATSGESYSVRCIKN